MESTICIDKVLTFYVTQAKKEIVRILADFVVGPTIVPKQKLVLYINSQEHVEQLQKLKGEIDIKVERGVGENPPILSINHPSIKDISFTDFQMLTTDATNETL